MAKQLGWLLAFASVFSLGAAASGADALPAKIDSNLAATADRSRALTVLIDKHIAAGWSTAGVKPAELADDAEFLRRVSLDLAGRIPSVAEVRSFLSDTTEGKRERQVERLLASPRYVTHWVNVRRGLLMPEANSVQQARFQTPAFENWLRDHLQRNAGYDALVRNLLTAPTFGNRAGPFNQPSTGNPAAYFLSKESKPENVAAASARVFLGLRLECAQCHDHPFAKWKRDQFWSLAAFFSGIGGQRLPGGGGVAPDVADRHELTIPGTERVVQAVFPDGSEPTWQSAVSTRQTLADWITAPQNPYFAKAAVNRIWYQLFGRGLVEPVDEMVGSESANSHPELLNELASVFVSQGYDLKFLIRAITASRAYQLTSAHSASGQENPRLFARMSLRGLTPEQLMDSLMQATGYQDGGPIDPRFGGGNQPARDELVSRFSDQNDPPTEFQTTILQALAMMNGRLIADQTAYERSDALASIVAAPFLKRTEKIETLYLATLSRQPTAKEVERAVAFIEAKSERKSTEQQAVADVYWALLNCGEFLLNH